MSLNRHFLFFLRSPVDGTRCHWCLLVTAITRQEALSQQGQHHRAFLSGEPVTSERHCVKPLRHQCLIGPCENGEESHVYTGRSPETGTPDLWTTHRRCPWMATSSPTAVTLQCQKIGHLGCRVFFKRHPYKLLRNPSRLVGTKGSRTPPNGAA